VCFKIQLLNHANLYLNYYRFYHHFISIKLIFTTKNCVFFFTILGLKSNKHLVINKAFLPSFCVKDKVMFVFNPLFWIFLLCTTCIVWKIDSKIRNHFVTKKKRVEKIWSEVYLGGIISWADFIHFANELRITIVLIF
jgi:hypothetical protein